MRRGLSLMNPTTHCRLEDGSVVAVIGAGPAGSFFTLLALREAEARGIRIRPVVFDGKSFLHEGPQGCNMCAGVISWQLIQQLGELGLKIPQDRVQRLIRSYVFHTKEGSHVVIPPPGRGPVPVVFRGNGPRFMEETRKISFDDFLLEEVLEQGAELVPFNVDSLSMSKDPKTRHRVRWNDEELEVDLVVVACGVTSSFGKQLAASGTGYVFPHCVRAFQAELDLGEADLEKSFGDSIHVLSLGIKDVRFAALIPKTRFVTMSLVGERDLSAAHLAAVLQTETVRQLLPRGWVLPERYCSCRPRLPVRGAKGFWGNRLIFIGDASMSRYYKNGIDSAFRTAKYAVQAAFDHGLSARTLSKSYFIFVRREFQRENAYARILFRLNDFVAARRFWVRAHLHFVRNRPRGQTAQTLYYLTWNLFTGDARYRAIFWTSLSPRFLLKMVLTGLRYRCLPRKAISERPATPLQPAMLSPNPSPLGPLRSGCTVAIVGGGPGGTSCGIALKKMAAERNIDIRVILYEGKVFDNERHYNQCAGVLSPPIEELLERSLGIEFPSPIIQRTIRSYRLCGRQGDVKLVSGTHRSYAVRRCLWDQFMLEQAKLHGVEVIHCRVTSIETIPRGVIVYGENGTVRADVVVGAFGLDPGTASVFEQWISYRRPKALETIITKIHPGDVWMRRFGEEILAFLPGMKGVSFGAITPKRDHLTVNIAGPRVNTSTIEQFLCLPEVKQWLPPDYEPTAVAEQCHKGLFPNRPARVFFADRFVAIGDASGMVRPFKGKGITAACKTGVAAAKVMTDYGISRKAFHAYRLACRPVLADRTYGLLMQKLADALRMTDAVDPLLSLAQEDAGLRRALFLSVSGEEPYRKIFREGFQISRAARILREILRHKVSSTS
jgi:flavin-dependent dehydrogenase